MERYSMDEEQYIPERITNVPYDDQMVMEHPDLEQQANLTGWLNKVSFGTRDTFNEIDFQDKSLVEDKNIGNE
jgi:hypothetical protein